MRRYRFSTWVMLGLAVALLLMPGSRASAQDGPLKAAGPDASFTFSPANPVVGQVVQFTDTSTGDGISEWSWDFDDRETSNQQNPTHTFTEDGHYEVKLTVTNQDGNNTEIERIEVFVVVDEPVASFVFSPADPVVGHEVRFSDNSGGGPADTWEWDYDDGENSTQENPLHTFDEEGNYDVKLTVTNSAGSSDAVMNVTVSANDSKPEASFSFSPADPVAGHAVRFTDTSGGGPGDTWEWDFDDGENSTQRDPSHTFHEEGNYDVKLTVTNPAGSSDAVMNVTVSTNESEPEASFSFSPDDPLVGQPVQFTDTSGGGSGDTWEWDFDDGENSTQQNPSHTFDKVGIYHVKLTVTNSAGSSADQRQVGVEPNESEPEANFSFSPANPAVGQSVQFANTSGGGPGDTWGWDFDDGENSAQQNPSHTFDVEGDYEVKLTVTNSAGSDDVQKDVTISTNESEPEASFSFSPTDPLVDQAVKFTDTSGGGPGDTWEWDFDDGENSTQRNPTHSFDREGTYHVSLTVTNSAGQDTVDNTVEVTAEPGNNPDLDNTYFVASASHAAGAEESFWITDVDVNNAGDDTATYEIAWLPRNTDNTSATYSESYELEPGEVRRFKDVVKSIFNKNNAHGALAIISNSKDLLIFSRTYNQTDVGTVGTAVPGVARDDLVEGDTRRRLLFFTQDVDFRSNIAFLNATASYLIVKWERFTADGTKTKSGETELKPWGNKQLNEVFKNEAPVEGAYMDVWTETSGGAFVVFSSVVDNNTGDGTAVQPQW